LQGENRSHLIGISCITITLFAAFWLFGLGEKIFFQKSHQEALPNLEHVVSVPSPQVQPQQASETTTESSAQRNLPTTSGPSGTFGKRLESVSGVEQDRLSALESRTFRLDLKGSAFLTPSTVSKDASLTVKMAPISGTKLESFEVKEAKIMIANTAMTLKSTAVSVTDQKLTMLITSEGVGEFTIYAHLGKKVVSDGNYRQDVALNDQTFYLPKKSVPYKLVMSGTLTSISP